MPYLFSLTAKLFNLYVKIQCAVPIQICNNKA